MDSWFTHAPLIQAILDKGLDVIGMVKESKQCYRVENRLLSLRELYAVANPVRAKRGILRSVRTQLKCEIPVLIVFVQHRSNKKERLVILSTD